MLSFRYKKKRFGKFQDVFFYADTEGCILILKIKKVALPKIETI
jgi:hypothetical protein